MPEVAFVELPPKKSSGRSARGHVKLLMAALTVLVEQEDVATIEIDSMRR